jgi:hypothetical protein
MANDTPSSGGMMESEIKVAWIQGYIHALFEFTALEEWGRLAKLAAEAWRDNCENLSLIGSLPAAGLSGQHNVINAGASP